MIDKAFLAKLKAWFGALLFSILAVVFWLMWIIDNDLDASDHIMLVWLNIGCVTPAAIYYVWRLRHTETPLMQKLSSSILLSGFAIIISALHLTFGLIGSYILAKEACRDLQDFREIRLVLTGEPVLKRSSSRYDVSTTVTLPQNQYPRLNFILPDGVIEEFGHEALTSELQAGDTLTIGVLATDVEAKMKHTQALELDQLLKEKLVEVYSLSSATKIYFPLTEETISAQAMKPWYGYLIIVIFFIITPAWYINAIIVNRRKYKAQNPWRLSG